MVTAISSSMEQFNAVAIKQIQEKIVDQIFQAADKDSDGKITRDEMSQAADTVGFPQGLSADETFQQLDTGNKEFITRQDAEAALNKLAQEMETQKQQGTSGGRPSGGPPMAAGSGSASDSSTDKIFDKKDTNKDGIVSYQEELEYAMNNPLE